LLSVASGGFVVIKFRILSSYWNDVGIEQARSKLMDQVADDSRFGSAMKWYAEVHVGGE
jgi:hypothetical protein